MEALQLLVGRVFDFVGGTLGKPLTQIAGDRLIEADRDNWHIARRGFDRGRRAEPATCLILLAH